MRKLIASVFAALIFTSPALFAQDMVISGGAKGGNYHRWATNLATLLKGSARIKATVKTSGGSKDNIGCIQDGSCHVAFTQVDAMKALGAQNVEILGDLGKECVFLVVGKDGKIGDEDDLQDKSKEASIGVGRAGSGAQVTWSYMQQLEEGYKATSAAYQGGSRGLAQVAAGRLDAMIFVTAPGNLNHKLIAGVNASEKLEFIDVDDSDLNDKLPDGRAVYTFESIDTKDGFGGGIETICTGVVAIGSSALTEEQGDAVADLFLTNAAAITK